MTPTEGYILLWLFPMLSDPAIIGKLGALAMILVGLLVEKHFISRPALFMNVVALNVYAISRGLSGLFWYVYVNLGLILGIVAIIAYGSRTSLSSAFYLLAHALYNSAFVGAIILFT